jgi:hypothetical protein
MELKELLEIKVSCQDHFWTEINETDLKSILNEIKSDKHGQFTNYLRGFYSKGDKENYGVHKRKLPVVTFCGSFGEERTKEFLKNYNYLIVLDIDKLGGDELERVKRMLSEDNHVFSFWESPSKDGIKGLVHIKYNFDIDKTGIDNSHKIAFSQLVDYFLERYQIELDKSGSDITRLCFISQDKELILKDKIVSFDVEFKPIQNTSKKSNNRKIKFSRSISSKDVLFNPNGRNNAYHRKTIKNIIKFLTKNSLSITDSYEKWLRVAFAISNSFTFDIGLIYFIELCILDTDKFIENECRNLLMNCYENTRGEIGFNTIIHLAVETGFKYKNINAKST